MKTWICILLILGHFLGQHPASGKPDSRIDTTEYLILFHLDGSNGNSFNEFEIGSLKAKSNAFKTTAFASFSTESGVHLGMTMDSLIAIKGKTFRRTDQKGKVILTYRVTDTHAPNNILVRYNMPIYEAQYFFMGNKLIRFVFGFPNL